MQTAINAGWLPATRRSIDEKIIPQAKVEDRLLPPLRPIWGHLPRQRGINIRPVQTQHDHGHASMLVRRMYSWRGYNIKTESPKQLMDDPNRVTLAAWQFDEVVATLTVGRDSTSGLLADELYSPEIATLRRPGRVVCEVSRLAVDPDFSSKDLLTSLIHSAYQYAMDIFGASDAVIEVNPRHAGYYKRFLNFKQLGNVRQCPRVDAPAVLLHQNLDCFTTPPTEKLSWGQQSSGDYYTSAAVPV